MSNTARRWFDHPFALFEDNLSNPGQLYLLEDLLDCICAYTPEDIAPALSAIDHARQEGHWLAFAGHYELGAALEASLQSISSRDSAPHVPLLQAWVFKHKSDINPNDISAFWQNSLTLLSPAEREASVLWLQPRWTETRHSAAVERILEWILAGDCYQANLTFPLSGQACGHPLALFARLREVQLVAHGALVFDGRNWILSRSPELFVARRADTLTCQPMKGTAARSADPATNVARAAALHNSAKDRAENLMIVDLIRSDLGRLASAGTVRVERLFKLETYHTIHQLTSTVSVSPNNAGFETILRALFPCGSITGAPKIRAMQIIHALEDGPRGLYCGALGWLAPDGDFSLNVPIRTLLLNCDGEFRLDVGSGIVADSHAQAEYQECLAKAEFVRSLGSGLLLIETLRWEPETGYHLLDRHLVRLSHSAKSLRFELDSVKLRDRLQAFASKLPATPHRIRLTLARDGKPTLQAAALNGLSGVQHAALAPFNLTSYDPRLGHKTSARGFYDQALRSAQTAGLFDLIFCNERGELCEGARSNLFLELGDGPMQTPAKSCGLLPGVLRAQLLAEGQAVEAVLYSEDLEKARRIWLGNALRGLVEVRLVAK